MSVKIQVIIEAVVQRCSVKKVFLEISQNSQENTIARVSIFAQVENKIKGKTLRSSCSQMFFKVSVLKNFS